MIILYSKGKVPIRLTQERWDHITSRHPEIQNQKKKVEETISDPDLVQKGDFGELLAVRFYSSAKCIIVAYKESTATDGFVLTAYFTNAPSKRRQVIWKR